MFRPFLRTFDLNPVVVIALYVPLLALWVLAVFVVSCLFWFCLSPLPAIDELFSVANAVLGKLVATTSLRLLACSRG